MCNHSDPIVSLRPAAVLRIIVSSIISWSERTSRRIVGVVEDEAARPPVEGNSIQHFTMRSSCETVGPIQLGRARTLSIPKLGFDERRALLDSDERLLCPELQANQFLLIESAVPDGDGQATDPKSCEKPLRTFELESCSRYDWFESGLCGLGDFAQCGITNSRTRSNNPGPGGISVGAFCKSQP